MTLRGVTGNCIAALKLILTLKKRERCAQRAENNKYGHFWKKRTLANVGNVTLRKSG